MKFSETNFYTEFPVSIGIKDFEEIVKMFKSEVINTEYMPAGSHEHLMTGMFLTVFSKWLVSRGIRLPFKLEFIKGGK